MTTLQVMEEFVKPQTAATGLSWCDHLVSHSAARTNGWRPEENAGELQPVATAQVFLSHAWLYLFLDVVDAVERHFRGSNEDPSIWFDVFSVSQHKSQTRDFNWWQSTFLSAVGSMGRVLMVMQPWDRPTTLTRVWCIFEAYSCEATRSNFGVAMTESESNTLVSKIGGDPEALLRTLSMVSCEACKATEPKDRDQILEVIKRSVGFVRLDSMVSRKVEMAVYQEVYKRFNNAREESNFKEAASLGLSLGKMCQLMRNHREAEEIFRECIAMAIQAEESNAYCLQVNLGLAVACSRLGQKAAALAQYKRCRQILERMESAVADSDENDIVLEVLSGYALEYLAADKQNRSENPAAECLSTTSIPKSWGALHNLALLMLEQGQAAEAQELISKCLQARQVNLLQDDPSSKDFLVRAGEKGLWHPDALDTLALLARALQLQEKCEDAATLLTQLLALRERFLGPEHGDTKETRSRLLLLAKTRPRASKVPANSVSSSVSFRSALAPSSGGKAQKRQFSAVKEPEMRDWESIVQRLYSRLPGLTALQLSQVQEMDMHACEVMALQGMQNQLRTLDLRSLPSPLLSYAPSCDRDMFLSGTRFAAYGQTLIAGALGGLTGSLQDLNLRSCITACEWFDCLDYFFDFSPFYSQLDLGKDALLKMVECAIQLTKLHSLALWSALFIFPITSFGPC
jgi:tetratricopeptide (TPR) repeat protein